MSDHSTAQQLSRRSFLARVTGIGLGTAAVFGHAGSAGAASALTGIGAGSLPSPRERIGVQLYTVRDQMQADFEGTIARVSELGYREVEFAGYYGRTPQQVRTLLDRLGLRAPSAHVGANALREDLAGQIRMAKVIGHQYLTLPSFPVDRNGGAVAWQRAAAEFNRIASACRDEGLRLAYHNHAWEFAEVGGGRTGYDILLAETDPALVDFELDLYWAVHAGRDPIQLFQRHPGRFTMWHVKDMRDPQGAKEMVPVGQGVIPFRAIFAQSERSGMRHFFVEHDNAASTVGSLPSIEASFRHLHRMLS
jgi:sugar phosphate isomerase/epimerase